MLRKKYFLGIIYVCIISIGILQIGFSQESNNDFEQKASNAGINLNYIKQQTTISRYDVTRLLNTVECIDCINPSNQLIDTYTNNFWIKFTALPGKDFDDIFYKKAIYNNQSYYYCVASVADKEYMFGYPILTSPLCPGGFCGSNNMTRGEFVQVITNILSKYIRKNYTTDWNKVKIWYNNQSVGSYSYNIFNAKDKSIIINKAEQCKSTNCDLGGSSEFRTYLKYCMFNLEECQMKEFGRITQGYWPIAELNIAIKEGIIMNNDNFINTIHKPIDGKTAVEAFGRIFPKIQCNFDNDYDCDGVLNQNDNCPNHYNSSQTDTDNDTIGDVCDDDIDGDGVKNPIGIVDERGGTNMNLRTNTSDNCLFVQNPNQIDFNTNYQGDACEICKSIPSFCLLQKTKGIASQCDSDKDNIDDRCDDDIDGDGVKNPIGLVIENHSSCDITKATIDKDKRNSLMNSLQDKILRNASCISVDNCPLLANTEQDNSNLSPQGNLCEAIAYNISGNNSISGNSGALNSLDSDGDGVSDLVDKCPLMKETKNGYEDYDGCAEVCGNNDVDCDGVSNNQDNCPSHYNPNQTDTDNDTIGDVCDNDIDGDGITNPIGIVDERGSINISIRIPQTDNCLFIQNNNQQDTNNNYQGDSCDLTSIKGVSIGANIIGTGENSKIYAYIITDYSPIENDRIRNIDGKNFFGKNISYDIKKSGIHTLYVQSKSDPRRKASTSLITEYNKGHINANLGLSLSKEYLPTILTAKIMTNGSPDSILRNLEGPDNQTKTTKNSLTNGFLIRKEGNYILTSTLKNKNNETIGITSRSFIIENENNNIQNININTLTPLIGEQITMNIDNTIKERKVNRGDSISNIESKNNISHIYTKDGTYIIESTITLSDNTKINDYKTIITKKENKNEGKILEVKPFILEGMLQSPINLIIKRIGYIDTNIITRYTYDGILVSTGVKTSIGGYNDAGIYYPETKEILGICQYTASQSTVVINSNSFSCLNMKIKNIKAQCDMDGDGIDDRCDDDIDGDGVKNPIGLVIENHSSCDITKATIDKDKRDSMMNQLQGQGFDNICKSLDNCPLQANNDQTNTNDNGLGDQCENNQYNFGNSNNNGNSNSNNGNNENGDSDNDGINDNIDNCPTISETYNGYQDNDGCPELGNNNICDTDVLGDSSTNGDPTVGFECLQCPCQYAQESADINPGDIIRATLRNISGSILQSRSNIKTL